MKKIAKKSTSKKRPAKKKTTTKKRRPARKTAIKSLGGKWKVVCSIDGSLGKFSTYEEAKKKKDAHTPESHRVKIIGKQ